MLDPILPDFFLVSDSERRGIPDERKTEKERVFHKPGEPSLIRQNRMVQSELGESPSIPVDERGDTELLRKTIELPARGRTNRKIHEMRLDATLGKKAEGLSRVRTLVRSENLNFQTVAPVAS